MTETDIDYWRKHFFIEAKRIFQSYESCPDWEDWRNQNARDIEELYAGMPVQLREIVDEGFDDQPHHGELLVRMAHVYWCAEQVLGKREGGSDGVQPIH
jgi:hypothetical protein